MKDYRLRSRACAAEVKPALTLALTLALAGCGGTPPLAGAGTRGAADQESSDPEAGVMTEGADESGQGGGGPTAPDDDDDSDRTPRRPETVGIIIERGSASADCAGTAIAPTVILT